MNINWVYYSDTNSPAEDIKATLDRKNISFNFYSKNRRFAPTGSKVRSARSVS